MNVVFILSFFFPFSPPLNDIIKLIVEFSSIKFNSFDINFYSFNNKICLFT